MGMTIVPDSQRCSEDKEPGRCLAKNPALITQRAFFPSAVTIIAMDGILGVAAPQPTGHAVTEGGVSSFQSQSGDSWL